MIKKMSNTTALPYKEVVAHCGVFSKVLDAARQEVADIKTDYREGGLKKAFVGHASRQADSKTLADVACVFGSIAVGIAVKDPTAAAFAYGFGARALMNQAEKLVK